MNILFKEPLNIQLPNAIILFNECSINKSEADQLFTQLTEGVAWQQGEITMFGKKVLEPRLSAWYGDEGKIYTYSGKKQTPLAWNEPLLFIKNHIESIDFPNENPLKFNSVLCNYYRNGQDSMGWHSDDEKELGHNPIIASVNFGESRRFLIRHKQNPKEKREILLTHGSVLIMGGAMQHYWQHAVPKEKHILKPRINLTFRYIY